MIGLLRAFRVSPGLATNQWVATLRLYKPIQQPTKKEAHPERTPSPVLYRSACLGVLGEETEAVEVPLEKATAARERLALLLTAAVIGYSIY